MPLESMSNEQINIHDLSLEQEKKPMPEWQKHYENLKKTPLYDAGSEQWRPNMDENQISENYSREADDQLLGVLVESDIDKSWAEKLYETLKKTQLYDRKREQWNNLIDENQELKVNNRYSRDQLVGILVESKFDKTLAQQQFEVLKKSKLHDEKRGQWNEYMGENQILEGSSRRAGNQLLGILIEAQFNTEAAHQLYNSLKETPLYDEAINQWNFSMHTNQQLGTPDRFASDQLLGVLIEAKFNKESARALYENLKKTELYDAGRNQWNYSIGENQKLKFPVRRADVQLLGILCEKEFEEQEPDLNNPTTPLPETRNY